jgi:hypothetical protein
MLVGTFRAELDHSSFACHLIANWQQTYNATLSNMFSVNLILSSVNIGVFAGDFIRYKPYGDPRKNSDTIHEKAHTGINLERLKS